MTIFSSPLHPAVLILPRGSRSAPSFPRGLKFSGDKKDDSVSLLRDSWDALKKEEQALDPRWTKGFSDAKRAYESDIRKAFHDKQPLALLELRHGLARKLARVPQPDIAPEAFRKRLGLKAGLYENLQRRVELTGYLLLQKMSFDDLDRLREGLLETEFPVDEKTAKALMNQRFPFQKTR